MYDDNCENILYQIFKDDLSLIGVWNDDYGWKYDENMNVYHLQPAMAPTIIPTISN